MKNKIIKLLLLWVVAIMALPANAQQRRISYFSICSIA